MVIDGWFLGSGVLPGCGGNEQAVISVLCRDPKALDGQVFCVVQVENKSGSAFERKPMELVSIPCVDRVGENGNENYHYFGQSRSVEDDPLASFARRRRNGCRAAGPGHDNPRNPTPF